MSTAALIGLDWGTSVARAYRIAADGTVIDTRSADCGLQKLGARSFAEAFTDLVGDWSREPLPRIAAGMIGSRNGWIEVPYVDAPATLAALAGGLGRTPGGELAIVPGVMVRDREGTPDVIRGEETQLLGALASGVGDGLFCMPGTHSKWVALKAGTIADFATYMTGELFGLLSRQSILAHAISDTKVAPDNPEFLAAVAAGVDRPADIANRIFEIRPAQLLGFSPIGSGAVRLSGALIGTEIAGARVRFGKLDRVHLIASGSLSKLYAKALEATGSTVDLLDADAVVLGGLHAAALRLWS